MHYAPVSSCFILFRLRFCVSQRTQKLGPIPPYERSGDHPGDVRHQMGPRSLVMGEFLHLLINMWKLLKKLVETIETCEKHGTYNRGPLTELYHLYLCGNIWKLLKKYRAFELFLYISIQVLWICSSGFKGLVGFWSWTGSKLTVCSSHDETAFATPLRRQPQNPSAHHGSHNKIKIQFRKRRAFHHRVSIMNFMDRFTMIHG